MTRVSLTGMFAHPTVQDLWVQHPQGQSFTRQWSLPDDQGKAPILFFYDSLGCVAFWRSFPEALCTATGRRVVSYDRLGFGQSNPHPDRLGLDFITDEARTVVPVLQEQVGLEHFLAFGHSVDWVAGWRWNAPHSGPTCAWGW